MSTILKTVSRVSYWLFVVMSIWTLIGGMWYWLVGIRSFDELSDLIGLTISGSLALILFLLGTALNELSKMHSDDSGFFSQVADVASTVSEKARAAAKGRDTLDKD